jgi:hypothetical protein
MCYAAPEMAEVLEQDWLQQDQYLQDVRAMM